MATANTILEKLESIRDLPTLPVVAQKVAATAREPNADARRLASIIEDDPAIMARILRVVNSALYAGTEEVTSVQHAVARMGINAVSNIAMSTSVFSAFGRADEAGFDRQEFWRHSISTGIAASVLRDMTGKSLACPAGKDVLHLVGLLHDIGRLLLDQYFPSEFGEARALSRDENLPLTQAEKRVIGADHGRIGAWLAVEWQLADELVQVIRCHHDPESAPEQFWPVAALCHAGDYACNLAKIGNSGDNVTPAYLQAVWDRIGLSVAEMPAIVEQIREESAKSEVLMSFV